MKSSDMFDRSISMAKLGKSIPIKNRSHSLTLRAKVKVKIENQEPMTKGTKTCLPIKNWNRDVDVDEGTDISKTIRQP